MKRLVPFAFFIAKGFGYGESYIESFENALRSAGIEKLNIVPVSSILPYSCRKISKEVGIKLFEDGEIAFAILSKESVKGCGSVFASVSIAYPHTMNHGYFIEFHEKGNELDERVLSESSREIARRVYTSKFSAEPRKIE